MPQPFSRVSALLLPLEGCRDLMKFLLLLLCNTDYLPDMLHCISSCARTQVGVVWEIFSARAPHLLVQLSCCDMLVLSTFPLDPEGSRESFGTLMGPLYSPRQIWLVAKMHLKIGISIQRKPHTWVHCLPETKHDEKKMSTPLFCWQFGHFNLAEGEGFSTHPLSRTGNTPPAHLSDNLSPHPPALWPSDNLMASFSILYLQE